MHPAGNLCFLCPPTNCYNIHHVWAFLVWCDFMNPTTSEKSIFYSIFGEGIEEEIAYEHSRKLG